MPEKLGENEFSLQGQPGEMLAAFHPFQNRVESLPPGLLYYCFHSSSGRTPVSAGQPSPFSNGETALLSTCNTFRFDFVRTPSSGSSLLYSNQVLCVKLLQLPEPNACGGDKERAVGVYRMGVFAGPPLSEDFVMPS